MAIDWPPVLQGPRTPPERQRNIPIGVLLLLGAIALFRGSIDADVGEKAFGLFLIGIGIIAWWWTYRR